MKAILVIDNMPQNCQKCFACINIQNFMAMCVACGEKLKISELDIKPSYCPLKPMPQKRVLEDFVQNDYCTDSKADLEKMIRYVRARANNEIIDEILGEENK